MKKIKNPISISVELYNAGENVVFAKVAVPFRTSILDRNVLGFCILDRLLPDYAFARVLRDGAFVVVSYDSSQKLTNFVVDSGCSTIDFDAAIELEDGLVHAVSFHLEKTASSRRDYVVYDTRTIILRGDVTLEADDDETQED